MPSMNRQSEQDFWSAHYCGRRIAVFNQHGRWHAYLDDVHQHDVVFVTAESAMRWLAARAESLSFKRAA
jgi:hypothetical protein